MLRVSNDSQRPLQAELHDKNLARSGYVCKFLRTVNRGAVQFHWNVSLRVQRAHFRSFALPATGVLTESHASAIFGPSRAYHRLVDCRSSGISLEWLNGHMQPHAPTRPHKLPG